MIAPKKHLNIQIFGRVQGVGFRFSTVQAARKLGIKGFVKNEYDGSVYIEAEANPEQLNDFTNWCRNGPYYSDVADLRINEDTIKNFETFEIKY